LNPKGQKEAKKMQGEKGLAILVLTLTTTVTLLILPSLFLPLPAQGVFSQEGEVVLSKKPCVEGCDTVHLTQHCWHPCHIDAQGECVNAPCVLHSKSGDTYLDQCSCGPIQQAQWLEWRKYDCNNDGIPDCKCMEKFFTPKMEIVCAE
jgi:hypothetical protein